MFVACSAFVAASPRTADGAVEIYFLDPTCERVYADECKEIDGRDDLFTEGRREGFSICKHDAA